MIQDGTQDFYSQQAELARQYRLRPQTTMTATENIAASAQPESAESQNHQQTGAPAQGVQAGNCATEKIAADAQLVSDGDGIHQEDGPPGSGGWKFHAEAMERERDYWRQRAQTMHEHQDGQVWYWQGDGNDHPESMVNSLPVVIRADQLRALIAGGVQALSAAPAVLSDEAILNRTGCIDYSPGTAEYDLELIRWYRTQIASPTPPAEQAAPKAAPGEPHQRLFGGCPECGSRSCVARQCSRTISHSAQAIPGVQWQCGPQASGFAAPQQEAQEPAPSTAEGATYHLGACIVEDVLYATVMRKEPGSAGAVTVLLSEKLPVNLLHNRDVIVDAAPQPAPATQQAGDVVAYLDVGAGGYLDLGSELSEDALQQLPKGRHALVIAGTYGIDGYVAAPQPSPTAKAAPGEPRFNCWSTNEGDSWFDHPADAQAIYDCLGNDAKVGDEYELTAGWNSVTARYRITEVVGDGEEYEVECISHPRENTAPRQEAQEPAVDDPTRWLTVVYRDISPGDEARLLAEHPKASAMSWPHAIRDRDAARAVLAKWGTQPQAGAVPQGWKAVPVNPTPEMWKAAKSVPDPNPPYPPHYGLVWDAMLAASPTPPAEQQAPSAAAADTVVLEAALRAIHQSIDLIGEPDTERLRTVRRVLRGAVIVAEDAGEAATSPQPAPAPLSAREIELLDSMIDVQLNHAQRCDSIPNRPMAEKQKGWDMERVTLLRKLKATMGGQQA